MVEIKHISVSGEPMTKDEVRACRCDGARFFYTDAGEVYQIQHSDPIDEEVRSSQDRRSIFSYPKSLFVRIRRRRFGN